MATSVAVSIPDAAVRLGRSERTVWRQIRSGELKMRREGRRVFVLLDEDALYAAQSVRVAGHRIGEAAMAYSSGADWEIGTFPYTSANLERHRQAKLARRRAAIEEIKRLAALSKPDPDGLTAVDYIRAERDHPRALEGGDAADRALEELARERRRHR